MIQIGDYPYLIDAPYGFYAGPQIGVGKNCLNSDLEAKLKKKILMKKL